MPTIPERMSYERLDALDQTTLNVAELSFSACIRFIERDVTMLVREAQRAREAEDRLTSQLARLNDALRTAQICDRCEEVLKGKI